MPQRLLSLVRIAVILVSLGLIAFLLQQGELSLRIRIVVLAALAYYGVRLWLMGSRARRQGARRSGGDRDVRAPGQSGESLEGDEARASARDGESGPDDTV